MSPKSSNSCAPDDGLDEVLAAIRQRYSEVSNAQCGRRIFLNRLRSLARFDAEPNDYQCPSTVELPKELEIGYAVCHPECGNQAFVVIDGGPQSCDACGSTMYPVEFAVYRKKR